MGTSDLPDMYAQGPRAAPSGFGHTYQANHRVPMLQILCNTSKADSLVANTRVTAVSFIYPWLEDSIMVRQQ